MTADPQQRRHEKRRVGAARACLERLAQEGYADATLDALAQDAGLTKQSLLFYFRDKADLWAEAVSAASEEILAVLGRLIVGEAGPTAIRALRRGLDEVARVLPAAFAVLLDGASSARASAAQKQRASLAQEAFLGTLSAAVASPAPASPNSTNLARFAWLSLLALHRDARAWERSGLTAKPQLAAALDFAEDQLVSIVRAA